MKIARNGTNRKSAVRSCRIFVSEILRSGLHYHVVFFLLLLCLENADYDCNMREL